MISSSLEDLLVLDRAVIIDIGDGGIFLSRMSLKRCA